MAEIHVQPKKKFATTWFWILLFLIIIAAVVVYIMFRDTTPNPISTDRPTSYIELVQSQSWLV